MGIHLSKCLRCPPSIQRMFLEKSSGTKTALLTESGRTRDKQFKLNYKEDQEADLGLNDQYPSYHPMLIV